MNEEYKKAKILIVEHEVHINRLIELLLLSDGYFKIQKAFDEENALKVIKEDKPDLILLDLMLQKTDGLNICKIIKNDNYLKSIQIIMLTARKKEEDILKGFETGAIDYIEKPFSNKILLAKIKAHLSNLKLNNSIIKYKNFILDNDKKTVKRENKIIKLTKFEFIILQILMSNIGRVYSRSQLLSHLRGDNGFEVSERAIDVQIVNLRRKLGLYDNYIETVRGIGYKLKEDLCESKVNK